MYPESVKEATGAVIAGATVSASAFVVTTLTHCHLNASLLTMKSAKKIEDDIKGCQPDTTHEYHKMRSNSTSYASSSIISAVAALESNINKILTDVLITDKLTKLSRIEVLFSRKHDNVLLDKLTNKYNRFLKGKYNEYKTDVKIYERFSKPVLPIMFKYDIMSCILAKDLVPDSPIKSDVILLINIRNFLVHYNIEVEEKINEDTIRFTEKKMNSLGSR